jgi:hypothetical protein
MPHEKSTRQLIARSSQLRECGGLDFESVGIADEHVIEALD